MVDLTKLYSLDKSYPTWLPDISNMDTYVQELRDVPQQDVESPWHVVWPTAPKIGEDDPGEDDPNGG